MPGARPSASLFEDIPTDGRSLYRWAETRGLVKWFMRLGKSWSLPPKLIDWQGPDVAAAVAECQRKSDPSAAPARNGR
jgi:hypothetical protein